MKQTGDFTYLKSTFLKLSLLCEAFAAINRPVISGLERNLAGFSAGSTNRIVHLALGSSGVFAGTAAGFASLRLICKSFFSEKVLLAGSKYEFLSAILACESFVFVKQLIYLIFLIYVRP